MTTMMKFRASEVPAQFYFQDPDKPSHIYTAPSRFILNQRINTYRQQNKLTPIDALDSVVDNYLCERPENVGKCEEIQLRRGWLKVLQGGVMLFKNFFYGEENLVLPEEAERRAEICVRCPHNVFPDKGSFVKWSDDVAESSTGGKKTTRHLDLGSCAVCTCTLKAKVWLKGPFATSPTEKEKMQSVSCWQTEHV